MLLLILIHYSCGKQKHLIVQGTVHMTIKALNFELLNKRTADIWPQGGSVTRQTEMGKYCPSNMCHISSGLLLALLCKWHFATLSTMYSFLCVTVRFSCNLIVFELVSCAINREWTNGELHVYVQTVDRKCCWKTK